MGKEIRFFDIEDSANELRKALSILDLMIDILPADGDQSEGWRLAAASDFIYRSLKQLDQLIENSSDAK